MHRVTPFFAHVYATSAVLAFVATFLPLWSAEEVELFDTMNLWEGAAIGNHGGEVAQLGLMLALVLVAVLVLASVFVDAVPVLPGLAAVLCVPGVVLLVTKPYSSTPKPDLGTGGAMLLALTIVIGVVATAHVVTRVVSGPGGAATRPPRPDALPLPDPRS